MFCGECLQRSLAEKRACPLDCKPIDPLNDIKDVNRVILQLLSKPKVHCLNRVHGCDWIGPRGLLLGDHRPFCEHTRCQYAAEGCSFKGLPATVRNHVNFECPATPQLCQFASAGCTASVRRDQLAAHLESCKVGIQIAREEAERAEAESLAREAAEAEEAHLQRVEARKSMCVRLNPKAHEFVTLNVGGREFQTTLATLRSEPRSLLAQLFNEEQHTLERDGADRVLLDCDSDVFALILQWLRLRVVPCEASRNALTSLRALARALELDELVAALTAEDDEEVKVESESGTMLPDDDVIHVGSATLPMLVDEESDDDMGFGLFD